MNPSHLHLPVILQLGMTFSCRLLQSGMKLPLIMFHQLLRLCLPLMLHRAPLKNPQAFQRILNMKLPLSLIMKCLTQPLRVLQLLVNIRLLHLIPHFPQSLNQSMPLLLILQKLSFPSRLLSSHQCRPPLLNLLKNLQLWIKNLLKILLLLCPLQSMMSLNPRISSHLQLLSRQFFQLLVIVLLNLMLPVNRQL